MREKKALRRSSECIHREETSMTSVCKLSNYPARIAEFFTDADLTSLNAGLMKDGISAKQIVAIFPHAGATLVIQNRRSLGYSTALVQTRSTEAICFNSFLYGARNLVERFFKQD
jgi:hypothetical protein